MLTPQSSQKRKTLHKMFRPKNRNLALHAMRLSIGPAVALLKSNGQNPNEKTPFFCLSTAPNTPMVLLVFSAGPLNISFADTNGQVVAILQCFFPAQATGHALRAVLLNDGPNSAPAGRSPYTWPLYENQVFKSCSLSFRP